MHTKIPENNDLKSQLPTQYFVDEQGRVQTVERFTTEKGAVPQNSPTSAQQKTARVNRP